MINKKTYYTLNYGCQMNASDMEHYAGQLEELGYELAPDFHEADVIIVNTCCVRESAEKRILGKIGELKQVKTKRPDTIIIVAGCMAQKDGEKLQKKYPQVDLLLGTAYVNDFKQILLDFLADRKGRHYTDLTIHQSEFEGHAVRQSSFHAWIPIMYGCNNFCTYCIVPYVRGRERSRSMESIVAEIERAVAEGYKEFTLLGQNVNSYGKEFGEPEMFSKLLRRVNDIPGVERVHFMTSHPKDMSEEVIKAVSECEHLCEGFHVAMQSGSTEILRRMNRGYSRERYLELVRLIRSYVPDAAITTDIIVGFPGETEQDFQDTLSIVDEVGFTGAFTFIYSRRSGTPAAKMENQIPLDVKHVRLNRLMELQNKKSLEQHTKLVGKVQEVLVEGPSKNPKIWTGRTRTGVLVLWPAKDKTYAEGAKVNVRITAAQTWLVKGEDVEN